MSKTYEEARKELVTNTAILLQHHTAMFAGIASDLQEYCEFDDGVTEAQRYEAAVTYQEHAALAHQAAFVLTDWAQRWMNGETT